MGMDFRVVFLRSRDNEEYKKKLAVLKSCMEAGVEVPDEVDDYFDGTNDPDYPLEVKGNVIDWDDDGRQGYDVDVKSIPSGVERIRFEISY